MNPRMLQQATGDRARSMLTAGVVVLLALGGLVLLGLAGRPQAAPAAGVAVATPAARPTLPGPYRVPEPSVAVQETWPPTEGARPVSGSTFLARLQNMLLVLTLTSLLVWALLRLLAPSLAGMGRPPGSRRKLVNILERQSLGPGKGLLVVEVAGRHLLLGMTDQGVHALAELTAEEIQAVRPEPAVQPVSAPTPSPEPSRNLLGEVLSQHLSAIPGLSSRQRGT